jgi:hypothetical protein
VANVTLASNLANLANVANVANVVNAANDTRRFGRVALVHEWLVTYAGSEKVVEQILQLFPQADLFSVVDFFRKRNAASSADVMRKRRSFSICRARVRRFAAICR